MKKWNRCGCAAMLGLLLLAMGSIGTQGRETTGMVPITELGEGEYKGQKGGLYGGGQNTPAESQLKAAKDQTSLIQPLDPNGVPSPTGTIVLISLGMSNTTQEFSTFKKLADADPNKSPQMVIVDCAQGGQAAYQWAYPGEDAKKPSPWPVMDERIQRAGVTAAQVQVVWLKQAEISPARLGEFPAHAQVLRDNIAIILRKLKARYPNLHLAYLSSRIYAGYATTALNPEPYAYESAFSVRWLIEAQVNNDPNLNYDAAKGPVVAPLLLWGPYLWADGTRPRQGDGMVWLPEDLGPDGTHPSTSGRQKVARMLLSFFKTDANTQQWFLRPADHR
jgi:lysophospholipase L1-like esterase